MILPRVAPVRRRDTHRLIPAKFGEDDASVLAEIADDDRHLSSLVDLDRATDDRVIAESNLLPGIGIDELVFGIPYFRTINAAFCHAHPLGSRFNGPDRGAWYAAFDVETSQAEVAFHKSVELAEVGWAEESIDYDDHLADFDAELHDLRRDKRFAKCLAPDSYVASQDLARRLLDAGSMGVVYPSARRRGDTCLACFRPALVTNVRKAASYRFVWSGSPLPSIALVKASRATKRR